MRKAIAAGLLLVVGLIIAMAAGAFPCGPDSREILCGYECESRSCIQDMYTPEDDACIVLVGGCIGSHHHGCCGSVSGAI